MNATFVIALLLAKDVINAREAKLLNQAAVEGTSNTDLSQMFTKVQRVLNTPTPQALEGVGTIDAKTILK